MVRLGRKFKFHKDSGNISVQEYDFSHKVQEGRLLYFRSKWNKYTLPHSRSVQNFLLMISFAYAHPSIIYDAKTFFTLDPTGVGGELQFTFVLRLQNSAFIVIGFSYSFGLLYNSLMINFQAYSQDRFSTTRVTNILEGFGLPCKLFQ